MKRHNPNQEVERWKDAVYKETRKMNDDQLDKYFQGLIGEIIFKDKNRVVCASK